MSGASLCQASRHTQCLPTAWLNDNDSCIAHAQHSDGHRSTAAGFWNIRTRVIKLLALMFLLRAADK